MSSAICLNLDQSKILLSSNGLIHFTLSISTVSSGVNALALVCLTDIVKPIYKIKTKKCMPERIGTILSEVLGKAFCV